MSTLKVFEVTHSAGGIPMHPLCVIAISPEDAIDDVMKDRPEAAIDSVTLKDYVSNISNAARDLIASLEEYRDTT